MFAAVARFAIKGDVSIIIIVYAALQRVLAHSYACYCSYTTQYAYYLQEIVRHLFNRKVHR